MPKLTSYKRIITNDFPKEDKKLVEQLATPVNDSFNELYFAMNGRISIQENLYCTYKEFDVTVDASGTPTGRVTLSLARQGASAIGSQVISAISQSTSGTYPTGTPFMSLTQNNDTVIVNNITNLAAGERYIIRAIIYH